MNAAEVDAAAAGRLAAGDVEGAIAELRAGQGRSPHPVLATNLGRLLWRRGAVDEAAELLEWAVRLAPEAAAGWVNLGDLRAALDDPRAGRAYRRAVALVPDPAEIHWSIAVDLLTQGEWRRAWPHAAWRCRHPRVRQRPAPYPPLAERRRPGGRLLVWSHEGIGEDLRHVALLPALAATGFQVVLEVDARLVPLFARSFPAVEVVARAWPPHPATADRAIVAHSALGDLPAWFGLEPDQVPAAAPWLRADRDRAAALRARYRALGQGPVVGIAWESRNTPLAEAKSLAPAALASLLAVPGLVFVDLQYGARAGGGDGRLFRDPGIDPLADLDGFAAQVAALDLVVSSSNSTVHMAGALGVPTWTLVHRGPPITPYWIAGRPRPPWYRSMTMLRQDRPGDWSGPLEAARRGLGRVAAGSDAALTRAG
ncbi:hypothetical protein [Stella sp.]|uniref:hypothetical protein n=1 Tax=Stella sp. TaxID=2912054 RepID=UPI0035B0C61E